ncbi:MAG: hypothetical protein ACREC4_02790 [Methylocella sp.]
MSAVSQKGVWTVGISGGGSSPSPAQEGTDGTGITPPTGAVGIRGWLSGIFNRLGGAALESGGNLSALVTAVQGAIPAGTNVIGDLRNITGTVSLPTGASTSANQPTNAAQGSVTSGQTGSLAQAAASTTAPTITTAQTNPLSTDLLSQLRIAHGSNTLPFTPVVTSNGAYAAGNMLGGLITVTTSPSNGFIQSISIMSRTVLATPPPLLVYFFTQAPSGTFTDKNNPVITVATENTKVLGFITIPAAQADTKLGNTTWSYQKIGINFALQGFTMAIVVGTGGMTLTSASTSDITGRLTVEY